MPGGARGPAAAAAGEEAARLAPCLAPAGDGFMARGQHEARLLAARHIHFEEIPLVQNPLRPLLAKPNHRSASIPT